jgi:hypothetical protein
MSWKLSRYRAGDLVEIKSKEEILATLDERGCAGGMPFMPEMLKFCGKRLRVSAVAHKTCDTAKQTSKLRQLEAAVHLDGARCDGSAHGGCQAECNLFWRDEWLRPGSAKGEELPPPAVAAGSCSEAVLHFKTRQVDGEENRYACQATQLYDFTEPLAQWDPRQYLYDLWSRNHSTGRVLRVLFLATLRWVLARIPIGYRLFKAFHDAMHLKLAGRPAPSLAPKFKKGEKTPTGRLNLRPGELVRIKSQKEIEQTVDGCARNRGLTFDPEEMAPYCGRIVRVKKVVTQIIDEPTGKMIYMKQPCIMLEGVVCIGEFASCRLNCPRAIPSYWRELWLERVSDPAAAGQDNVDDVCSADLCNEPQPAEAIVGCEASGPTPSNCVVAG